MLANVLLSVLLAQPAQQPTPTRDPYSRVQEAKRALDAGQYARVLKIVDELLVEYPRSQSSWLLRALALDELARFDEAQRSYAAALRIAPNDAQIQARYGMHCVRRGQWAEAIPLLERSLGAGDDALALFYLSQAYFHAQNKVKALATIERCVTLAPDNPTMLLKLGEYRAQMGKHSPALEALLEAQKLNPQEPGLDAALGNVYLNLLEVENARAALERALAKDPENPAVISALATACSKARDHAAARKYYERVIALGYDEAEYELGLGAALLGLGESQAAVVHLNQAVAKNPRLEEAHFHLARAYQATGQREDAARELGVFRALKANPLETLEKRNELERDLWRQAEALLHEGREAEALKLLTRSNVKGNVPEFLVGALYYRLGRLADAERLLTRAVASAPDTPNVRTFLALTYTEEGRLDEAAGLLAAEIEQNPREPLVLMALGQLSFRRKSWAEAARYLQESKVVVPAALLMLCEAQLELGQRPAAQDTARVLAALEGGSAETLAVLERLFERFRVPLEGEPLAHAR